MYIYCFSTLISQHFDDHQEYTKHVKQDIDGRGFFKLFQRKYALSLTVSDSSKMKLKNFENIFFSAFS